MDKKSLIKKILAYIGLIVITICLCIMGYGLVTGKPKLILSMIFALIFISILFYIGIRLIKDRESYEEAINKKRTEKEMYDLTHKKTRGL